MGTINSGILSALQKFYKIIDGKDILWILSGSTSLFVQGVDSVINNDIDILTDKTGSLKIDELLKDFRIEKSKYSSTEKYQSYFSKYEIDGVSVEIMGEFQYRLADNEWSKPNQTNKIIKKEFEGMLLPMLELNQELKEYENLGRTDKVERIKKALDI